jgi:hypothetical protein
MQLKVLRHEPSRAAAVVKVEDLEVEVSKACLSFLLFMSHIVILFQLMAMEGINNTRGKKK